MRIFHLILIILLFYLVWRLIKPYFAGFQRKSEIRGKRSRGSIEIDERKVEDAKFKDIED